MKDFRNLKTFALLLLVVTIFSNIISFPTKFELPNTISTYDMGALHDTIL